MSKLRTEICIESNESFLIRRKRYSIRSWCESCERIAIFVLPIEAAFLSGLGVEKIVSLVCSDRLHKYDAPRKGAYVCLTSLCMLNQTFDENEDDLEVVHELPEFKEHQLFFFENEPS